MVAMATYRRIGSVVKLRHGYFPAPCWIADVKARHGLTTRVAHNRRGPGRVKPCPPDRVAHIEEALKALGGL